MKNKEQTIGQGFLILSLSNIAVKILSLFFVPIIKLLLGGYEGYSVYSTAYSVYAFVYVIATAGLPVAISKTVSELSKVGRSRDALRAFKIAKILMLAVGLVLMLLVGIFAKPLASFMQNDDSWAGILMLAPTVFVCSVLSAYRGYFQGRKNMRPTAVSQVLEQIFHVLISCALIFALKGYGIVWAVAGATLGTLGGAAVALVICLLAYKKDRPLFYEKIKGENLISERIPDPELLKKIFYYSIPLLISSAVQYGGDLIDSKMIKGSLISAGFTESAAKDLHGQFMAMRQLINVPGSLATALCVSVLPAIASSFAAGDRKAVDDNTFFSFRLCYMVAVPISFAFVFFSEPIYKLLGYGDNNLLLTLTALSVILLCTIHLQSSVLQGVNRMFTASGFMCLCVIIKAVLNGLLIRIPSLNIYGAIIATYCSYIIPAVLNFIWIKRVEHIKFSFFRAILYPAVASLGSMAAGFGVYYGIRLVISKFTEGYFSYLAAFGIAAVVCVILYYIIMRLTKGLTDDDLAQISPKLAGICKRFKI